MQQTARVFGAVLAAAVFAQGCAAQPQQQRVPAKIQPITILSSDTEIPCRGSGTCPIPVTMSGTADGCIATIDGSLHVYQGAKPTVIWTLDKERDQFGTYEFHEQYGILVVSDPDEQVKNNAGGPGQGGQPNKKDFFRVNKNNKRSTVLYLPIVLRRDGAGNATLCAAVDPKIINDGP